jgi:hypothetical protein
MSVNRSLLSYPSYVDTATFAMISGTADATYPVSNLAVMKKPRQVFKSSGSGAISFKATLAADQSIQFLALIHHNATNGATYRFRCYSDTSLTTLVDDSGTLTFSISAAAQFKAVLPYALPSAQTTRTVRVDLSDIGVPWQIGAMETAGLIAWEGVARREIGLASNDELEVQVDGAAFGTRMFAPRVITSGRELVTYSAEGFTLLDVARSKGRDAPFLWVRSYEDPNSWEREAALVRFMAMPTVVRKSGTLVGFDLKLVEHLR